MFDLFRSREKSVRYLLGALLTLVALSMVITLIPGFGSGVGSGSDQIVAEIGKDVVTMREVQLGLQDTIRARQLPPELVSMYVPQIINQLVVDRAMAFEAERMGFKVTDEDVAQAIQQTIPMLYQDGKFVGKDLYAQYLSQQNMSIADFEKNMRQRVLLRKLQNLVLEGMVVTPAEIEREFRERNEKVALEYVMMTAAQATAEVKVTPLEIETQYNSNKPQYRVPEKRDFDLLLIDEKEIAAQMQLNDDELRKVYDLNREQYRVPERVKVRHILIKTADKSKEEQAKLRAKAEDLLKQIKAGADFGKLARENSEDPGSKDKGGDLDWVARGQTVKNFEQAAFTLKPKQLSDVITTEYGFHILQVMEKEDARLKPFEEVKAEIAKERQKQAVYDRMQAAAEQARALLLKNHSTAAQVAESLKIQHFAVTKNGRGDPYPLAGLNTDLDDAIFDAQKGGVTGVVQLSESRLALAVVKEVHPARQAELAEVEAQIRQELINKKASELLVSRTATAMQLVRTVGGDLNKLAKELKLTVKKAPEFGRDGSAEGIGAASYLEEAFRRNVGDIFGPVNVGGNNFICKVVAKTPADMGKLAEQRADLLMKIKSRKAQERKDLFEDGLLTALIRQGKVKLHKDTIQRIAESYKGS